MRILLAVLFSLILSASAWAQFTTGPSEFPDAGERWNRYIGIFPQNGVGLPGTGQSYNFINAWYVGADTLEYISAGATSFLGDHPGAQLAKFTPGTGPNPIDTYDYYAKDSNAFWETGVTLVGDFGSGLDTLTGNHIAPVAVDTLLNDQYTFGHNEFEGSINWINIDGFIDVVLWELKLIQVDGEGTLVSPFNQFDSVIRVQTITYKYDSIFVNSVFSSATLDTLYQYDWYTPNVGHPVVRAFTDAVNNVSSFELLAVPLIVDGCTDPTAINFNPLANQNDSSCVYCQQLSYTISPDTAICLGDSLTLSISGGSMWVWNTGDSTSTINILPDSSQAYSVLFADTMPCWEQAAVMVDVDQLPNASAWTQGTWYTIGDSVQFVNASTEANQYFWDFDDAGSTSMLENPNHVFTTPGMKNIMLVVINSCGTDTLWIPLNVVPVGIQQANTRAIDMMVYPNPARGDAIVRLKLNEATNVEVAVMDLAGSTVVYERVGSMSTGEQHIALPTRDLPAGVYIASVTINGEQVRQKWVKL